MNLTGLLASAPVRPSLSLRIMKTAGDLTRFDVGRPIVVSPGSHHMNYGESPNAITERSSGSVRPGSCHSSRMPTVILAPLEMIAVGWCWIPCRA